MGALLFFYWKGDSIAKSVPRLEPQQRYPQLGIQMNKMPKIRYLYFGNWDASFLPKRLLLNHISSRWNRYDLSIEPKFVGIAQ